MTHQPDAQWLAPEAVVTRHLEIRGLVQGVGFRWSTVQAAQRLGVSGWVRNRRDGSVEALVHGPHPQVAALIDWARSGPPGARVDQVTVEDAPAPATSALQREFVQYDTA
ncbi:MAG: acylphosphatase [Moraxellaceae bacterium]|nr:acylphosphatase [Moraxellaceae bacterium]